MRGRVTVLGAAALLLASAGSAQAQRDSTARRDSTAGRDSANATLRVCAGGDVTLGTNLGSWWKTVGEPRVRARWGISPEPDSLLAPIAPLVRDADLLLLNVEGAIGEGRAASKCGPRSTSCFALRMPPAAAPALRALAPEAVVIGNLANNHARDAGLDGIDSTRRLLEDAGVLVTGLDSLATPVPTPRGDTIAVLGFYTIGDTLGTTPDARDLAAVRRHVARAAERWKTVIVTMHLGGEGRAAQRTRRGRERYLGMNRGDPVGFADAAFAGGATLVIGHGPHVMRAAQWRNGRLVLYSIGNLVTYGPFVMKEPLNRGAIACVDLDSTRIAAAELRSTVQLGPGVVQPDSTHRAAFLVDSLGRLDFPRSGARVSPTGVLELPREQGSARPKLPE